MNLKNMRECDNSKIHISNNSLCKRHISNNSLCFCGSQCLRLKGLRKVHYLTSEDEGTMIIRNGPEKMHPRSKGYILEAPNLCVTIMT